MTTGVFVVTHIALVVVSSCVCVVSLSGILCVRVRVQQQRLCNNTTERNAQHGKRATFAQ